MRIVYITKKEQLNNFVSSLEHSQFLQSWQWGEFQEKVGNKVFRLGVEDNCELVAVVTIIKKFLPMGKSYFYCPRGPIIKLKIKNKKLIITELFNKIKNIAKDEGVMFLRFEPIDDYLISNIKYPLFKTIDVQPSKTLILDLFEPEGELLKRMHQKTRYNIGLAERKGIKVVVAEIDRFDQFWNLLNKTSERDKFRLHNKDYYMKMLETDKNFIKLFLAEYHNKVIAANITSFFGDIVTYLHGASANDHRDLMAPYLLQWQVIKLAKGTGHRFYDFNGISEKKWPGVTRFKKGFAGEQIEYPGTFDLIYDIGWYYIYKMARKIRRTF